MSDEIQSYQVKCEDLIDEMKSLQGLLVLKNQRLSEEELNLKWFKIREEVLVQKRAQLLTGREKLLKEKVIMRTFNIILSLFQFLLYVATIAFPSLRQPAPFV